MAELKPLPMASAEPVATVTATAMPGTELPVATATPIIMPVIAQPATDPTRSIPSDLHRVVPEQVRAGEKVKSWHAVAYADSIKWDANNHTGCYVVNCFCGQTLVPMGCTHNCMCGGEGGECFCFPCLFPFPFPCLCSIEREGAQWITRGKYGEKTGALMIVDEEKGTIANFGVKPPCTGELCDEPFCYCKRVGG